MMMMMMPTLDGGFLEMIGKLLFVSTHFFLLFGLITFCYTTVLSWTTAWSISFTISFLLF